MMTVVEIPSKFYHGTSKERAGDILKNGFKLSDSQDMFYGKGLYLKDTLQGAKIYGDTILEVELKDIKSCPVSKMEGIGIFEQWAKIECDELDNDDCCLLNDKCFNRYVSFAEGERKRWLSEDCPIINDSTQLVIFDMQLVKELKPRLVST